MRAVFKDSVIVLIPDDEPESERVRAYVATHANHVLEVLPENGALTLRNLGPRPEACREPINIGSRIAQPEWRAISNFARTPFVLDGAPYASTEAFWQGLKFDDESDRRLIAPLHGSEAKKSAAGVRPVETFVYGGRTLRYASPEHWALMQRACEAKFSQDARARAALLSTGTRPLQHRMRVDSRSIPGVIMSRIWMDIRAKLVPCER